MCRSDLARLDVKIRERLQWSDMKLLRSILVFLDTRSWVANNCVSPSGSDSEDHDALEQITWLQIILGIRMRRKASRNNK